MCSLPSRKTIFPVGDRHKRERVILGVTNRRENIVERSISAYSSLKTTNPNMKSMLSPSALHYTLPSLNRRLMMDSITERSLKQEKSQKKNSNKKRKDMKELYSQFQEGEFQTCPETFMTSSQGRSWRALDHERQMQLNERPAHRAYMDTYIASKDYALSHRGKSRPSTDVNMRLSKTPEAKSNKLMEETLPFSAYHHCGESGSNSKDSKRISSKNDTYEICVKAKEKIKLGDDGRLELTTLEILKRPNVQFSNQREFSNIVQERKKKKSPHFVDFSDHYSQDQKLSSLDVDCISRSRVGRSQVIKSQNTKPLVQVDSNLYNLSHCKSVYKEFGEDHRLDFEDKDLQKHRYEEKLKRRRINEARIAGMIEKEERESGFASKFGRRVTGYETAKNARFFQTGFYGDDEKVDVQSD